MWDLKICRVCLRDDVALRSLLANKLEQFYQVLTGEDIRSTSLPHYLCFECSALSQKYYEFRQRCLRGQAILTDLHNTRSQVTLEDVQSADRSLVTSPYSLVSLPSHTLYIAHVLDECPVEELDTEIKIKKEEADISEKETSPEEYIKIEKSDDDDDFAVFEDGLTGAVFSSDEDEPLSLRARPERVPDTPASPAREKKKRKKAEKRKKKSKEDGGDKVERRKSKETSAAEVESIPKKRGPKPGSRRDDAELEEYCTIVKLSLEEQKSEIEERRKSSNYLNSAYKCHVCYKGFVDTDAFKHHTLKHDPSAGDVECPVCRFRFQTRRTLQKHAANHEKKYQCKSCPYISKTTTQAKQHQKWHKGITYKCQYCEEVLTKWTSYLSHVRIKHPSEHICNVCGYSFVSKLGLTMHKTMMHKDNQMAGKAQATEDEAPYCAECDVQFTSAQAWKRHIVTSAKHTHDDHFNKGCRVCGESFESCEELRLHHRRQHARKRPKNYGKRPSETQWPIKCEHCGEEVGSAREYWTHFRRAHPDKKYPIKKSFVCEICGKEFRGNAFLVYHKRTHSEEKNYKCAQCDKRFFNRTNLMMHEKTHSDHRPYPCQVCFKAFKLKGALDRHIRSHTGVKPYECEFCGKAFGQSNSRKLHIRTVHLKQPAPYVSKSRLERRRQTSQPQTAFNY